MDDDELDRLLLSLPPEQSTPALRMRVIDAAPRPRARRMAEWLGWGVGWAAAGVAGLVIGAANLSGATPPTSDGEYVEAGVYADPLQLEYGDTA